MPTTESAVPEPLVVRILQEAFSLLSALPEFGQPALAKLRKLAAEGDLGNAAMVLQAIRPAQGDKHESA